jgi:RNA polymerase sigma-70 factor (ECF subfamily)
MSSVVGINTERLAVSEQTQDTVSFPGDLALARRAAAQNEAAWREIYDLTRDRLFALLSYYTGDREEALELLQETYLSAIRSIGRYRGDGSLLSWFVIIALRRARDWKRKLVQWKRKSEALAAELREDSGHVTDEYARIKVREAVGQLKGNQRGAFLMRELEGLSFREIGQALGCDEGTARVHFFRARKTMQDLLGLEEDKRVESEQDTSRLGVLKLERGIKDKEARS